MSGRFARCSIGVDVGVDQARTQKQFFRDRYIDSAGMTVDAEVSGTIAALGLYVVPFGKVSVCRLLYVEAYGKLDLLVNGSATAIPVSSMPSAEAPWDRVPPGRLLIESEISSMTITNPSSSASASFVVYMIGT